MPVIIDGTNGVTFNDSSLQGAAASPFALKNRIINGDMRIDQRNAGASITANNNVLAVDRFRIQASQSSKGTLQQSTTAPTGFTNSLLFTSSSAYSITSSDFFNLGQNIEGYNVADLGWGTANAKTITISFWVRSSLTGTFGVSLRNDNADRNYQASYTISSANTWEQKTITVAGDTTGTWTPMTNNAGLRIGFGLGVGSDYSTTAGVWGADNKFGLTGATSVVGTNGATFYITGVQLEVGSSATPFERRLYNQELANCQRYYVQYFGTSVYEFSPSYLNGFNTTNAYGWIQVPVPMRASPSVSASNFLINDEVAARAGTSLTIYAVGQSNKLVSVLAQAASGITSSRAYNLIANNSTSAYIQISSEL
jgi:hypothetical protein